MKIVFCGSVLQLGGAANCTTLLCKRLKETDELHVIEAYGSCRQYLKSLTEVNIPVHVLLPGTKHIFIGHSGRPLKRILSLLKQSFSFYKLRCRLIHKILEIRPDVIWTHNAKLLFLLMTSWKLRKYPVVFYAHKWFRRQEEAGYIRWLIKHRSDTVLAVSNATSAALESWGYTKEKIHVVFHTVDFDEIIVSSRKKPFKKLPGSERDLKILVPSALLYTKGQHTAVGAAHLLKEKGYNFVMWLAGDEGITKKKDYVNHLRQLISDYSLENNVFILGWRNDIPSLMRLSDIVVFPTHSEGLGLVIEEAMLINRPVVSTPAGGVTDLIVHGQTGMLGPIDDEKGLADNIETLVYDKDLRNNIVENAYKQMFEKFSPEKHIKLVRAGFQYAIEKKL